MRVHFIVPGLSVAAIALSPTAAGTTYPQVVVFGDSLSDNGNLYSAIGIPESPPYWKGRFSNGPVWVEQLLPLLGLPDDAMINVAIGGMTTDLVLNFELQLYLKSTEGAADPEALYIIWAGANDLLGEFDQPPEVLDAIIETGVANLIATTTTLIDAGARRFFLPNVPDLGLTPDVMEEGDPVKVQIATGAADWFNALLSSELAELRVRTGAAIIEMDTFTALQEMVANPRPFGFVNVTDPALLPDGTIVRDSDFYLFWDDLHPTTLAHAILANAASALLTATAREDLNGDGVVEFADLLILLESWGSCESCPADLDGDGKVGFTDLLRLLAAWGAST